MAEARREEVVGLLGRVGGGVVALVARAQAKRRGGQADGEQENRGGEREGDRVGLHDRAPASPGAPVLRCAAGDRGAVGPGDTRGRGGAAGPARGAPDARPEAHEQGGQQRERGDHGHEHAHRRGHRHAVEKAHAENEHAEQRDDHRGAGQQHRAPGGVHGRERGGAHVARGPEAVPKAGDDEQRVVDADAEPDHGRQLGGKLRRVDHVGAKGDDAEAGADSEQRGAQRHPRGHERPEGQEQDQERGDDAYERGDAEAGLLGVADGLAAERDLQVGRARGRGGVDELLARVLGERVGLLVKGHRGKGGAPVARDARGAERAVGTHHAGDVVHLGQAGEGGMHRRTHRRRLHRAAAGVKHDLVDVARLGGKAVGEQVRSALGVRAGDAEVVRIGRADALGDRAHDDEQHDPADHHAATVSDAPAGQLEHEADS